MMTTHEKCVKYNFVAPLNWNVVFQTEMLQFKLKYSISNWSIPNSNQRVAILKYLISTWWYFNFKLLFQIIFQSSHRKCSIKKGFLHISENSQENTCASVSFFIKFFIKLTYFTEHLLATASMKSIMWGAAKKPKRKSVC